MNNFGSMSASFPFFGTRGGFDSAALPRLCHASSVVLGEITPDDIRPLVVDPCEMVEDALERETASLFFQLLSRADGNSTCSAFGFGCGGPLGRKTSLFREAPSDAFVDSGDIASSLPSKGSPATRSVEMPEILRVEYSSATAILVLSSASSKLFAVIDGGGGGGSC